jgi:hypothetical protein
MMSDSSVTENRSGTRTTLNKTVCFELHVMESGIVRKLLYDARCTDISQQGLCLVTDVYLKKGEILKILISPDGGNTPSTVFAEAIWSKFSADQFRTGLRFIASQD